MIHATLRDVLAPRERLLLKLLSKACNELVVDVVPCYCGAKVGEYCRRQNGDPGRGSLHVDRRDAAQAWKRQHPKEWQRLKDETYRRLVKDTDAGKEKG